MQFLLKRNECVLLIISILFLCLFITINSNVIEPNKISIIICRDLLFIYLLLAIILLHRTVRYVSCIMIFIAGFILFNCSRVFLSYFDHESITESNKYVFYTFKDSTIKTVLSLLGSSICACIIGYILNKKKSGSSNPIKVDTLDESFIRIVKILILICIPGLLYKSFHELMLIKTYGYLSLYMEFTPAPLFARVSWGVFNVLFPFLFMFAPSKRDFKRYLIFFFIVSSVSFLKGSRSTLLAPILFFVWYYYALYNKNDISMKRIIVILISVAFVANAMLVMRDDTGSLGIDIFNLLKLLLETQGVTYVLIGNYIDYVDTFMNQSSWYILFPIVSTLNWFFNPVYKAGQTVELVQHTLNLDDQIMYSIAPDLYFEGVGYGSSYIAELHALGNLGGVIIGSLLLGYFIRYYEKRYWASKKFLYFSWFFIPHLVWLSRGSFLPNIFMFLLGLIFYFFIRLILKKLYKPQLPKI